MTENLANRCFTCLYITSFGKVDRIIQENYPLKISQGFVSEDDANFDPMKPLHQKHKARGKSVPPLFIIITERNMADNTKPHKIALESSLL